MAGLQSLLEDWRNWSQLQDWKLQKQREEMFDGDYELAEDIGKLGGGFAGSVTRFPLKGLRPLLDRSLITGKSATPDAPVLVDYDAAGNLYLSDGTHRYYEAIDNGLDDIAGYYSPRVGRRLTVKEAMKLAPEYNEQLFDVGPRMKK